MSIRDVVLLIVFVVAWIVLITKVAPRLGVPT